MGKASQGANGPISGRVGNVVFYTRNGSTYVRSLPRISRKKRQPTTRQHLQRQRFAVMQQWLKPIVRLIRVGFGNYNPTQTGHNAAMSHNIRHAIHENNGTFTVDPKRFACSAGPLPPPINACVEQDGTTIRFFWESPGDDAMPPTARSLLLFYRPGASLCCHRLYGAYHNMQQDSLDFSSYGDYQTGDICYAYMAFIDEETGDTSDSVYAGTWIIDAP